MPPRAKKAATPGPTNSQALELVNLCNAEILSDLGHALDNIMAHPVFIGVENMQPAAIDSAAAKELAGSQAGAQSQGLGLGRSALPRSLGRKTPRHPGTPPHPRHAPKHISARPGTPRHAPNTPLNTPRHAPATRHASAHPGTPPHPGTPLNTPRHARHTPARP